jgi:hypothetical protein
MATVSKFTRQFVPNGKDFRAAKNAERQTLPNGKKSL